MQLKEKKITFFMLVTNRDCMIADYAIESYWKIYNAAKPFGNEDFVLFVYLNALSKDNLALYAKKWGDLPFTTLFDNTQKLAEMTVKPYPGLTLVSPEGIERYCDDYAENYDELWTTELKKFNTKYVATVDADFEILNADFYFYLINRLENEKELIAASSCYGAGNNVLSFDTYSQRNIYYHERNHTWFCIYKKEAFSLTSTSHYYFEEPTGDGHMMVYDSAARFQYELRKMGHKMISTPALYNSSFVHYGASSKNKTLTKANINYYRRAFLLAHKGIFFGKSNKLARLGNKVARKLSRNIFKGYLTKKANERSTFLTKDDVQ